MKHPPNGPSNCLSCGASMAPDSTPSIPYPMTSSPPAGVRRPTEILFCRECGLGMAIPVFTADEEKAIYSGGEYWKGETSRIELKRLALPLCMADNRFRFIKNFFSEEFPESVRILDIGAGQGGFGFAAASHWGSRVEAYAAVEPDDRIRGELKEIWSGLNSPAPLTLFSSIEEAEEGAYDLAALSHVIEHVHNPVEVLNSVKKYLKPEGVLLVDVPHRDDSFKTNVFPHVLFFNKPSLENLLEKAGFTPLEVATFGHPGPQNPLSGRAGFPHSLFDYLASRLRRFIPLKATYWLYNQAFGGNQRNKEGVWLRGAARPKP